MTSYLTGLRVLLVEDEMLVCMNIEDMLTSLGCQVVGPAAKVSQALTILQNETPDIAVLDVNLGSEKSYAIADRLSEQGTPFLFSTGYAELDPGYDSCLRIQKPFSSEQLAASLETLLQRSQKADDT